MKIGLVIECFDPRLGGAEGWTAQYAQRLLARGHEVHVVTQRIGGGAERLPVVPHCLGAISSRLGRAAAAEAELRTLDLDVIHDIGMGWHCHVLQSEDGSRLAMWEHRLRLLPFWLRPLKRRMIDVLPRYQAFRTLMARQFADPERIFIAISNMCAGHYQEYHGVAPRQIRVVYHGADVERFSPRHRARWREPVRAALGIREQEMVVLFVGHDYRRKGLATAIRAVRKLTARGAAIRLVVVGGQAQSPLAVPPRRSGGVIFVGAIDDPVPYFSAADAFVLPTFYDPFGLGVSEAAACGLPSVTSRFAGAAELLSEGEEGFIVADPADDCELAAALEKLLDADLRQRMGEAARRLALQHTLERNCDELLAIYRQVCRPRFLAA